MSGFSRNYVFAIKAWNVLEVSRGTSLTDFDNLTLLFDFLGKLKTFLWEA